MDSARSYENARRISYDVIYKLDQYQIQSCQETVATPFKMNQVTLEDTWRKLFETEKA